MKKSIFKIAILLSAFAITGISCSKDEKTSPEPELVTGKFEIYIDGSLFSEANTADVGYIQDNEQNYENTVTIGNDDISIIVSQFPRLIGGVVSMDTDSDPGVLITSTEMYGAVSGTLTRESGSRISFEGKCKKLTESQEYTISGYVESEAWKVID